MHIRKFNKDTDSEALRDCVVEIQDYERAIDSRLPTGASIAEAYIAEMFEQCNKLQGAILVCEVDGIMVGYISVWTKVKSGDIDDGDLEYGLINDLVVQSKYRGRGIGQKLLEAGEAYAAERKVSWLRIGVLAENHIARQLYQSKGLSEYQIQYEKQLTNFNGSSDNDGVCEI